MSATVFFCHTFVTDNMLKLAQLANIYYIFIYYLLKFFLTNFSEAIGKCFKFAKIILDIFKR